MRAKAVKPLDVSITLWCTWNERQIHWITDNALRREVSGTKLADSSCDLLRVVGTQPSHPGLDNVRLESGIMQCLRAPLSCDSSAKCVTSWTDCTARKCLI